MARISSGGFVPQAWIEMLLLFNLTTSTSSISTTFPHPLFFTAGTGLLAASFAFISVLLTLFLLRAGNHGGTAIMANGPTTNGNDAISNGKSADPSANFKGDIKVNNKAPTKEQLEKVADIPVLDVNKKSRTFKSLYADNEHGPRRVLVVFVRHFFCGNCQEYIRVLSESIPPSTLATLTPPTEIIIIGCGQPDIIPMYSRGSACAFPIYADPTRRLYSLLGMTSTLSLGSQTPEYMKKGMLSLSVRSFLQELRSGRNMLSGGDFRQVGGEFLFAGDKVTWCHRMKNTRDHAEIPEIRKQLRLDEPQNEISDAETPRARKRWSTAGLGAGLGRRLSSRRRSWAPSRSRSRNTEVKGSPPRSAMAEVKEEETATPEDALAKLEGKSLSPIKAENGAPIDGTANGTANGALKESKLANGAPIDGSVKSPANGTVNEAVVEEKIMDGAAGGMVNGLTNGHVAA